MIWERLRVGWLRLGHSRHRFGLAVVAAATLGLGSVQDRAEAYLFYDNGTLDYIVPASEAIRWSADAWGPGRTLVWELEHGPDWGLLFGSSAQDFAPFVEAALSSWSAIPTADISWRLAGVVDPSEDLRFGDSRNRVFFDTDSGIEGAVAWWIRNHASEAWEITECDLGIPAGWVEEGLSAEVVRQWALPNFLRQELAHCFGLGQAAGFPASQWLRTSATDDPDGYGTEVWSPVPAMADWGDSLAEDDRVGASLLRPRAGWPSTVGALAGELESEGESVPYTHVYALRRTPDGMRDPVGAFANASGEFLIEGLPPGEYILWAHPIRDYWSHRPLILEDAETDVKDAVLAHPVHVEPGRTTDGITIPMRRGRE